MRAPRRLLLLLAALGAGAVLWSLPPPPPPPLSEPEAGVGSAMPPPRQVTRSLSELGVYALGAGRELSDHALLFTRVPNAGAELIALLLKWLQASNGFRLVALPALPFAGEAHPLSPTKQEELVAFVTETLRKEALPVAFDGHVFFTNFSTFDRQSPAYVALVRDPVDKAMSRLARTALKGDSEDQVFSFVRCLEESWPECRTVQRDVSIPYFCGQDPRCMEQNSIWAFQQAKINIERYFTVVGVLEDLNATLTVLEKQMPLFFAGVQEFYLKQLLDPHLSWNSKRKQEDLKPHIKKKLSRHFGREHDLYVWIKQRLIHQLHNESEKAPPPGEAGQDRMAYSVHSRTHLIKH